MKVLKFQNEYYKKCEERQVSIADEIVEIEENKVDVPTETLSQEFMGSILQMSLFFSLLFIFVFAVKLLFGNIG